MSKLQLEQKILLCREHWAEMTAIILASVHTGNILEEIAFLSLTLTCRTDNIGFLCVVGYMGETLDGINAVLCSIDKKKNSKHLFLSKCADQLVALTITDLNKTI